VEVRGQLSLAWLGLPVVTYAPSANQKPRFLWDKKKGGCLVISGFTLSPLTTVHVLLSLIGILSGLVVPFGMFSAKRLDGWTWLFMVTTLLASVTGFFFPFHRILPSHILGVLSLIALAITFYARYSRRLDGGWRSAYVISAAIALYLMSSC